MSNNKHTEGKIEISPFKAGLIGIDFSDPLKTYSICQVFGGDATATANAERIVMCWNEFDNATDLLGEFVRMANDPDRGDLVWRLAIKEKAEALLRRTGGSF